MNKIVIPGEFLATGDLECIELIDNGYIKVADTVTELTIQKLVSHKKYPCQNEFEILVTGEDGADAVYGSGENGEDGKDGGKVKITVLDLAGDIHIKASGGNGGHGGKGKEGYSGGRGGDGGNGGKGAVVDFYYNTKEPDSKSRAYIYSVEGGTGGKGGSGGICTGSCGLGGECGEKGTAGAKFGDGGDGGANGKNGEIKIHRNETVSDVYTHHFENDKDLSDFIENHGGEQNLKKYPHIWNAVMETRKRAEEAVNGETDSDISDVKINASILQVSPVGVDSNTDLSGENRIFNYYKISAGIQMSYANSSADIFREEELAEPSVPVAYMAVVKIIEKSQEEIIYGSTLYGEGDVTHALDNLETDVFPYEKLDGKEFRMTVQITYVNQNGKISTVAPVERSFQFDKAKLDSYIKQIKVEDPHWKKQGKTSGNIVFLYGRTIDQQAALYGDADYWDTDGYYHKNQFKDGILRTIVPISGTIQLQNFEKFEVTGASIDSYQCAEGSFSTFQLLYNISGNRNTVATYQADVGLGELGQKLQDNGDLTYDSQTNKVHFDLKFPVDQSGRSPYDWNCNISGGFLDESSHKCYLDGCFVLNVAHKMRIGSTNDRYAINIVSEDALPDTQKEYFTGKEGSQTVYIPPIVIYWGCFAKDTHIKMAGGKTERADKIRIGDRLPAMGGKILTVAEILTGEDPEIINIKTEKGSIRVSGGHAMWIYDESSKDGRRKAAARLKRGDQLLSPYGTFEITDISRELYNDKVYNFIFEEEETANYIEANGYWSGDFYAQNEEEKKEPVQISEKARAVMQEFKEFTLS